MCTAFHLAVKKASRCCGWPKNSERNFVIQISGGTFVFPLIVFFGDRRWRDRLGANTFLLLAVGVLDVIGKIQLDDMADPIGGIIAVDLAQRAGVGDVQTKLAATLEHQHWPTP